MKNPSWVFIGGDLESIADIDAAISADAISLDEGRTALVVRVNHRLFSALIQPEIGGLPSGNTDNSFKNGTQALLRPRPVKPQWRLNERHTPYHTQKPRVPC